MKNLIIFDIDDTLVRSSANVYVVRNNTVVKKLTTGEFTKYKLAEDEIFDFREFSCSKQFYESAKPIDSTVETLKHDIAVNNKVVMVTARADFNDREMFLDTFRSIGINMDQVHVYRAGNIRNGSIESKKRAIVHQLLAAEQYAKAVMYDDCQKNLNAFMDLAEEFPDVKFFAIQVDEKGEHCEKYRSHNHTASS
jgi:hypothetical protein